MNKESEKQEKNHLAKRVNILFFLIFLLFSGMILRLGIVQIINGDQYVRELERTENITIKKPVPRGKIYDRFGHIIVDNEPVNTVTFTREPGSDPSVRLNTARKLADLIDVNTDQVTERDKKDYWIMTRPDEARGKLTDEEYRTLSSKKLYRLQLDRITAEDLAGISEAEMEVLAIKREFDSGYQLVPQYVTTDGVSEKEFALVSEHLGELPGVNTTTDWKRTYPYGGTFKSVIGTISSNEEGLPKDDLQTYLAKGYKRNDRVGISFLEKQYEDVLKGNKEALLNEVDTSGQIVFRDVVKDGKRGYDLVATVDMALQKRVEKIIEEELLHFKRKFPEENRMMDSAFVVMMNPYTGEVLAMAGKKYGGEGKGKEAFQDLALGTVNHAYEVGSSIKGATILTGYDHGVVKPGTYLYDTPIKIKATPIKKSWMNMGRINDLTALRQSSNVYMFRIAMRMGGYDYKYGESAEFKNPDAFSSMRKSFAEFGLGAKTGIDLPRESSGYAGTGHRIGNLMDLAIGQYDTYTAMQLAQYVSTIANGGYRMRPRLVKQLREPGKDGRGTIVSSFEPEVLNKLDMSPVLIDRVQEGFRQVFQEPGGTAYKYFKGVNYDPAGKTGTAETTYYGPKKRFFGDKTINLSLVGYAPFHKPEIAFSVIVPFTTSEEHINDRIGRRILDAYFELTKERNLNNNVVID